MSNAKSKKAPAIKLPTATDGKFRSPVPNTFKNLYSASVLEFVASLENAKGEDNLPNLPKLMGYSAIYHVAMLVCNTKQTKTFGFVVDDVVCYLNHAIDKGHKKATRFEGFVANIGLAKQGKFEWEAKKATTRKAKTSGISRNPKANPASKTPANKISAKAEAQKVEATSQLERILAILERDDVSAKTKDILVAKFIA